MFLAMNVPVTVGQMSLLSAALVRVVLQHFWGENAMSTLTEEGACSPLENASGSEMLSGFSL